MTLKLGTQHQVLEFYQVCSTDDPGLTLTYFTARSIWSLMLLYGKKVKLDFSETIVVYDLKLATHDRSDKKFLLTSELCPLGIYTCIRFKPPPPHLQYFILTVPRRYFCCGSLLLLVLAVRIYTLVQLLCK